jgi:predicted Zn-dependent protease with MMP-like domain
MDLGYIGPRMTFEEFEKLVGEALTDLPEKFVRQLDNVAVTVEEWPTEDDFRSVNLSAGNLLFGLYRGVPKTKRDQNYSALPDKIVIFFGPIMAVSVNEEEIKKQIRKTVLHEIAHHFGMSEEEIGKLP